MKNTTPWIRFPTVIPPGSRPAGASAQSGLSPLAEERAPAGLPAVEEPDPESEDPAPVVTKKGKGKVPDAPVGKRPRRKTAKEKEAAPVIGELTADPYHALAISVRASRIAAWKAEVARRGVNLSVFIRDLVEEGLARGS